MSRSSTGWITKQRRQRIYRRDGYRCLWCGCDLRDGGGLTLDHFVPLKHGGNDATMNLFTSCVRHNSQRQTMSVYHYAHQLSEPLLPAQGNGRSFADVIVMRIVRALATPLPR